MFIKVHKNYDRSIVAVCDENLIGKNLSEGNLCLNITERFYKGEKKTADEIKEILKNVSNVNLVGEKSINLGLEIGLIQKEHIIKIKGVPHAQFVLF